MYCSSGVLPEYSGEYEDSRCIKTNPKIVAEYIKFLSLMTVEKYMRTTNSNLTCNPHFQRQISCLVDAILESEIVVHDLMDEVREPFSKIFHQLRVLPHGKTSKGVFELIPMDQDQFFEIIKFHNPLRELIPNFQYLYGYNNGHCIAEPVDKFDLSGFTHDQVHCLVDQVLSAIYVSNLSSPLSIKNVGVRHLRNVAIFPTCDQNRLFKTNMIAVIMVRDLEENRGVDISIPISTFLSDIIFDETHQNVGIEYWEKMGFGDYDHWVVGGELERGKATIFFEGNHIIKGKHEGYPKITNCDLIELWS